MLTLPARLHCVCVTHNGVFPPAALQGEPLGLWTTTDRQSPLPPARQGCVPWCLLGLSSPGQLLEPWCPSRHPIRPWCLSCPRPLHPPLSCSRPGRCPAPLWAPLSEGVRARCFVVLRGCAVLRPVLQVYTACLSLSAPLSCEPSSVHVSMYVSLRRCCGSTFLCCSPHTTLRLLRAHMAVPIHFPCCAPFPSIAPH